MEEHQHEKENAETQIVSSLQYGCHVCCLVSPPPEYANRKWCYVPLLIARMIFVREYPEVENVATNMGIKCTF